MCSFQFNLQSTCRCKCDSSFVIAFLLHYTTLQCTTLHYTTVHCNTLQYTALHYTTVHYTTLHYSTLHYTTLHYSKLHYSRLHYSTLHYSTLHYTTLQYSTLRYSTLHYTALHYTTVHCTTLHYSTLHYTTAVEGQWELNEGMNVKCCWIGADRGSIQGHWGKRKFRRANLFITYPTWTSLRLMPGPLRRHAATNRLSLGTDRWSVCFFCESVDWESNSAAQLRYFLLLTARRISSRELTFLLRMRRYSSEAIYS
jgi:hypothetical protein